MTTNIKQILAAVIIVAAFVGSYLFLYKGKSTQIWGGTVVGVKDSLITVEGVVVYVGQTDSGKRETRTIEFRIKPKTRLTHRSNIITRANINSQEQFYPKTENLAGKIDDIRVGTGIYSITSGANLFRAKKAVAEEITYTTYDLEL